MKGNIVLSDARMSANKMCLVSYEKKIYNL